MTLALRRLAVCVLCSGGLLCWPVAGSEASGTPARFGLLSAGRPAVGAESDPLSGDFQGSPITDGLVIPGSPVEAEQLQAQREVRWRSAEAVAERYASRRRFAHLNAEQAAKVAREAFPVMIDQSAGGPPQLPVGQSIVGYPSDNTARLALGDGKRSVIESLAPIAVESSPGRRAPVNLSVGKAAGAFEPRTPVVEVRIPKHSREGVRLAATGVSLTPVDASGSPLAGSEGAVDGMGVMYAETQTDTDTVVKPTTTGFEADSVLRSIESPQQIDFRVGLPTGARLAREGGRLGTVKVIDRGAVLASVLAPSAWDAGGRPVPVSMAVSGDIIRLTVDHRAGEYQYPIIVDPVIGDEQLFVLGKYFQSHWKVDTSDGHEGPFHFEEYPGEKIDDYNDGEEIKEGEWGGFDYEAQGESSIYRLSHFSFEEEAAGGGDPIENWLNIQSKTGKTETNEKGFQEDKWGNVEECTLEDTKNNYKEHTWECVPNEVTPETAGNSLTFVQFAEKTTTESVVAAVTSADVWLVQTKNSTPSFDTSDVDIDGPHPNALYGSERWLPADQAYVKGIATDPGVGISEVKWTSPSDSSWKTVESFLYPSHAEACQGVICKQEETNAEPLTGLPEGKDTVTFAARNATDAEAEDATTSATVYVDNAPPHGIKFSGLGAGNEIGEGEYTVKAEATAGDAGMLALHLEVDGKQVETAGALGQCAPGPCTASAEWPISGSEFGAGEHKLTVTAIDRAGNVATETITLKVHHATSVPIGPGSVNPQSGEFSMTANDVSISAPGGPLTVTRNYRSRHLTAGSEGPLGPQWSLAVGDQESITKLPNGSATLTAATGGQTTFASSGGKLLPPTGDSNLALTESTNEKGETTAYVLKNAANGATTKFTASSGATATLWTPSAQEGPLPSQKVRYTFQTVEGVTEPVHAFAPEPAGVSCGEEIKALKEGCRVLTFEYAHETTAKGEKASEWNAYKNRLK